MANKRVLMLSDANSFWTRVFIEQVYKPAGYEVTLFPIWGGEGMNDEFYRENGVSVYRDTHNLPIIKHIPRLRMWARVWLNARSLCRMGKFDIVHNHYLSQRDLALGYLVKRRDSARWLCDFWGSDLLRASKRELKGMKPFLKRCDEITVHNESHIDMICGLCGEAVRHKTSLLEFGQTSFGAIDRLAAACSKRDCKAHFGIDPDSTVICLGYNATPAQRHMDMLDALAKAQCIGSATVVLQMTYGAPDAGYPARVNEHAKALGLKTVLFTDFMNETESAYLRLAADIYIHCIATDAFSTSMCEYICAGAVTLRGSWLSYPILDKMGIQLAEFVTPDALPALVDKAASGGLEPIPLPLRRELAAYFSWDYLRVKWLSLLEGEAQR